MKLIEKQTRYLAVADAVADAYTNEENLRMLVEKLLEKELPVDARLLKRAWDTRQPPVNSRTHRVDNTASVWAAEFAVPVEREVWE